MHRRGRDGRPKSVFFLTIDKAKFRKPVLPGDTIEYHMTKIDARKNMWWYRGEAKVAATVVAEAEVGAMIVRRMKSHGSRSIPRRGSQAGAAIGRM